MRMCVRLEQKTLKGRTKPILLVIFENEETELVSR